YVFVVLLLVVGGVWDRRWDRVILLARDDQERPAVGILGVDLGFGPGVEVRRRRLEERDARRRYGEVLVQLLSLILADGVGEGVAELLVGQRDRPVAVEGIAKHRRRRLQ